MEQALESCPTAALGWPQPQLRFSKVCPHQTSSRATGDRRKKRNAATERGTAWRAGLPREPRDSVRAKNGLRLKLPERSSTLAYGKARRNLPSHWGSSEPGEEPLHNSAAAPGEVCLSSLSPIYCTQGSSANRRHLLSNIPEEKLLELKRQFLSLRLVPALAIPVSVTDCPRGEALDVAVGLPHEPHAAGAEGTWDRQSPGMPGANGIPTASPRRQLCATAPSQGLRGRISPDHGQNLHPPSRGFVHEETASLLRILGEKRAYYKN